jgi:hypothetical protein
MDVEGGEKLDTCVQEAMLVEQALYCIERGVLRLVYVAEVVKADLIM